MVQQLLQRREVRKCCAYLKLFGAYKARDDKQRAIVSRQRASDRKVWLANTHPRMFYSWSDPDKSNYDWFVAKNRAYYVELDLT